MNIIKDSGINIKRNFIFYSLNYENKPFFIGKTINSLDTVLNEHKQNFNTSKFSFIKSYDLLSIIQIEDSIFLTECESILKKQFIINEYIKNKFILLNENYIGYVYHLSFNNVPFYIGSSKNPEKRFSTHLSMIKYNNTKLYNFINVIKDKSIEIFNTLKCTIICKYELELKDELRCMEQFFIEEYLSKNVVLQNDVNAITVLTSKELAQKYYEKTIDKLIENDLYNYECFCCKEILCTRSKLRHEQTKKHSIMFIECCNEFKNNYENLDEIDFLKWFESLSNHGKILFDQWIKNPYDIKIPIKHHCFYCDEEYQKREKSKHELTQKHVKSVIKYNELFKNYYIYHISTNEESFINWYQSLNPETKKAFDIWKQNPLNIPKLNVYTCNYCNQTINNIEKLRHEKSKTHSDNFIKWNKLFQEHFEKLNEINLKEWLQTLSKNHKEMYNFWFENRDKNIVFHVSKYFCHSCNIEMAHASQWKHKNTKTHEKILLKHYEVFNNKYMTLFNTNDFNIWYNNLSQPFKEMFNEWYKLK